MKEEQLELPIFKETQVEGIGLLKPVQLYTTQELKCLLARHRDELRWLTEQLKDCMCIVNSIKTEIASRGDSE